MPPPQPARLLRPSLDKRMSCPESVKYATRWHLSKDCASLKLRCSGYAPGARLISPHRPEARRPAREDSATGVRRRALDLHRSHFDPALVVLSEPEILCRVLDVPGLADESVLVIIAM